MKERNAAGRSLELREKSLDKLFSVMYFALLIKKK